MISRRAMLKGMAAGAGAMRYAEAFSGELTAQGPFRPEWESLRQWRMPEWFRDAKFGIWAHWSAQCVPEQGDWYARQMYIQGHRHYDFHVKHYGHPSKVGFKEVDHMWKAERWEPEKLIDLYVHAGAKYFVSLACHHDNLDCYRSRYHRWNTVNIGPKRDIVGTWAKAARSRGLRFGVSNHAAHAWHWLQTAYGYDAEGPMRGLRYDAYTLNKRDGRDKWWAGLDPQDLYTGRHMVPPDGIPSIAEMNRWHEEHDRKWVEDAPELHPGYARQWFLRCKDLLDSYAPDFLYLDDNELPLGQAGLDLVAHFYNTSAARNGGVPQCVVAAKNFSKEHAGATMLDIERGRADRILEAPWQTDTCIGDWHYNRQLYERDGYKTPDAVAKMLVDIVSKNGNLLLSIPVRGDGSIDEKEHAFLERFGTWMRVNGEGIYGTRPAPLYGEGKVDQSGGGFDENKRRAYDASDIRFTMKGERLFVFALAWPADGAVRVASLRRGGFRGDVKRVTMLGGDALEFSQSAEGLIVKVGARGDRLDIVGLEIG